MRTILERTKCFARDLSGATAIEYALMAAGIALAIVVTVEQLGTEVKGDFDQVEQNFGSTP